MSETFRFTAAACGLAQNIYYARAVAQEVVVKDWQALSGDDKARYVAEAAEILRARPLAPREPSPLFDAFVGITRAHAANVIARIDEAHPWGEPL